MLEKMYKRMNRIGINNIIFGVLSIIVGIVCVLGGARILKEKHKLMF